MRVYLRMQVMQVLAPRECHMCLAMATCEWYMSHKQVRATLPVIWTIYSDKHLYMYGIKLF